MKKTFIRVQSIDGSRSQGFGYTRDVRDMMLRMRTNNIPFLQGNSFSGNYGSRRTLANWSENHDLLIALVRDSDIPLIRLLNTHCRVSEEPEFKWRDYYWKSRIFNRAK